MGGREGGEVAKTRAMSVAKHGRSGQFLWHRSANTEASMALPDRPPGYTCPPEIADLSPPISPVTVHRSPRIHDNGLQIHQPSLQDDNAVALRFCICELRPPLHQQRPAGQSAMEKAPSLHPVVAVLSL